MFLVSGFSASLKASIRERDSHTCARCGRYVAPGTGSVHHRRPRGMGGSRDPLTNHPAALVLLCGHATERDTCHWWTETYRLSAKATGWLLKSGQDPTTHPVRKLTGEWWQPGEVWERVEAPEGVTA